MPRLRAGRRQPNMLLQLHVPGAVELRIAVRAANRIVPALQSATRTTEARAPKITVPDLRQVTQTTEEWAGPTVTTAAEPTTAIIETALTTQIIDPVRMAQTAAARMPTIAAEPTTAIIVTEQTTPATDLGETMPAIAAMAMVQRIDVNLPEARQLR